MKRLSYILLSGLMLILSACEKDTESTNFAPVVTTGTASNIYRMGATLSGSITLTETNTAKEYGILFSELESMAEYDEYPVKDGSTSYSVLIQNLEPGETYYYCAYASSGYSIAKSQIKSFTTTQSNAPVFNEVILQSKDEKSCAVSVELLDEGGSELLMTGFVWAEAGSGEPTIKSNVVNVEPQGSRMSATIKGMEPNKTYLVRAYAVNAQGVGYSNSISVTTNTATVPFLSNITRVDSTEVSITLKASVVDVGLGEVSKYGFCYSSESKEPTTAHLVVETVEGGIDEFTALIEKLNPETTYYFRAFAENEKGVGYSNVIEYTTAVPIPIMNNIICIDSTEVSVTVNSGVIEAGLSEITKFGFCYSSESQEPTIINSIVDLTTQADIKNFTATIGDLNLHTTYYFRAFAENEKGVGYSNVITYTTQQVLIQGTEGDVHVEEAGGLSKFIDDTNKYNITKLKVSGYLNGDDIRLIREMAGRDVNGNETNGRLVDLDISEATIVAGGDYYYLDDGQYKCWANDNIIGKYMFSATILNSILLPNNAVSLGNCAFSGCTSLANISIPDNVVTMGIHTFRECTALTDVKLGNSVTKIDEYDFLGCTSLVNINIPNSVTSIGDFAFSECASLEKIDIPNSVTSIGSSVFQNTGLKSVIIPDNITSISDYVFNNCSALESVTIPIGVTSIGRMSFSSCPLSSIIIPENVTFIDGYAFYKCTSLSEVTCNAIEPPLFGDEGRVFDTSSSATLHVPSGTYLAYMNSDWAQYFEKIDDGESHGSYENGVATVEEAGTLAFLIPGSDKYSITKLKVVGPLNGDDIRFIREMAGRDVNGNKTAGRLVDLDISEATIVQGGDAYYSDGGLTNDNIIGRYMFESTILSKMLLPASVTSIEHGAFFDCISLTSIILPKNLTSISNQAFQGCSSLTSITIPDGVTEIENSTFAYCTSLTSITLPENLTSIGGGAFYGCSSLTSINIPDGVTSIGMETFSDCSSLTSISIPDGVTFIDKNTFDGCTSLTSITIPDGVTKIGAGAFSSCRVLTSINIPDGVTSIDDYTFQGCSSLASINIPRGVTSIGYQAFYACSSLASINIPSDVTSIGDYAFYACSFTSIILPYSIISIGDYAFSRCCYLSEVTCNATTPPSLGSEAFEGIALYVSSSPLLIVPTGCSTAYNASDWAQYFTTIEETTR